VKGRETRMEVVGRKRNALGGRKGKLIRTRFEESQLRLSSYNAINQTRHQTLYPVAPGNLHATRAPYPDPCPSSNLLLCFRPSISSSPHPSLLFSHPTILTPFPNSLHCLLRVLAPFLSRSPNVTASLASAPAAQQGNPRVISGIQPLDAHMSSRSFPFDPSATPSQIDHPYPAFPGYRPALESF